MHNLRCLFLGSFVDEVPQLQRTVKGSAKRRNGMYTYGIRLHSTVGIKKRVIEEVRPGEKVPAGTG